jgi:hypothetical protein
VKNFLFIYFFVFCLTLVGCTTTNKSSSFDKLTNEQIEAYNNDPNNTDKIVCRTETPIGSRVPKRVCRMESVINERARQDQQSVGTIQRTQTLGTMPESGPGGR